MSVSTQDTATFPQGHEGEREAAQVRPAPQGHSRPTVIRQLAGTFQQLRLEPARGSRVALPGERQSHYLHT